jgi:hypothetical protein
MLTKFDLELGIAIIDAYGALNNKALNKLDFPTMKQLQHAVDVKNLIDNLKKELSNAQVEQEVEVEKTGNLFAEEG